MSTPPKTPSYRRTMALTYLLHRLRRYPARFPRRSTPAPWFLVMVPGSLLILSRYPTAAGLNLLGSHAAV